MLLEASEKQGLAVKWIAATKVEYYEYRVPKFMVVEPL
jgi:hypothetical protein